VAFEQANHYVISGKGINAVVDTAGITGAPTVTLEVDGESVNPPTLRTTQHGIVVDGTGAAVPDSYTYRSPLRFQK
jgi:hypothetical protein